MEDHFGRPCSRVTDQHQREHYFSLLSRMSNSHPSTALCMHVSCFTY